VTLALFAALIATLMVILIIVRLRRTTDHSAQRFDPVSAWLRAGIMFCFFYLVSWATGTMEYIVTEPIVTPEQLADPAWRLWAGGMVVFILIAYWGIWARFTIRFERKLELLSQIVFGLLWGTAFGQMFLSLWHIAEMIGPGWTTWQVFLLAYAMLAFWQWFLMDMYWDIYISPEHDTAYSIALKVVATHIPNSTLGLIFFALYGNHVIFIGLQCLALMGCSITMRMPSPWCKTPTPPARTAPSKFFGLPRCAGYKSADPANDIYLKQAHLPR